MELVARAHTLVHNSIDNNDFTARAKIYMSYRVCGVQAHSKALAQLKTKSQSSKHPTTIHHIHTHTRSEYVLENVLIHEIASFCVTIKWSSLLFVRTFVHSLCVCLCLNLLKATKSYNPAMHPNLHIRWLAGSFVQSRIVEGERERECERIGEINTYATCLIVFIDDCIHQDRRIRLYREWAKWYEQGQ